MAGNRDSGKPKYGWDSMAPRSVKVLFYDTDAEYSNMITAAAAFARRRKWHVETKNFRAIGCLVVIRRW